MEPYGLNTRDDSIHLVKGQASGTIIQHAQQQNIGLIVMGTLGRAGIARLFIGNMAENALRNTHGRNDRQAGWLRKPGAIAVRAVANIL